MGLGKQIIDKAISDDLVSSVFMVDDNGYRWLWWDRDGRHNQWEDRSLMGFVDHYDVAYHSHGGYREMDGARYLRFGREPEAGTVNLLGYPNRHVWVGRYIELRYGLNIDEIWLWTAESGWTRLVSAVRKLRHWTERRFNELEKSAWTD